MISRFNRERHILRQNMVLEALDQNLIAISMLLETTTIVDDLNGKKASGILGYPAAILLFSIVDTIGTYYAKSKDPIKIKIDNEDKTIKDSRGHRHFYILNSDYFGLNLSENDIKAFYNIGRSTLVHNSSIGKELTLTAYSRRPFLEVNDCEGKGKYVVHLPEFNNVCKVAVELFKTRAEDIFRNSPQGQNFQST